MFYLAPEAWKRYKLLDMHDDLKRSQSEAAHAHSRATESLESLEENLSRSLVLVHSLMEALVRKGLVTREEIAATAAQLDMLDGQADGKLATGTLSGSIKRPDKPLSTQEFLGELEKK